MTYLQKIIQNSYNNLPNYKKSKPWSYVNHGVDLLKNEDELNCYLAAYGKMHEEKIYTALSTLSNIKDILNENYQIIDWGCGQGLATLCFLDLLKEKKIKNLPKKVTLIEPSKEALTRANDYIKSSIGDSLEINLVKKLLDDVNINDVQSTEKVTINFFSNILDIGSVDLKKLANLIGNNLKGEQYFICVGPMNATSTRIDEFAKLLNFSEEQIIGNKNGKLKTTRGTIKLLVIKIEGEEIEIIKSIYYPTMPKNNNIMHILEKKLQAIDPNKLNSLDRVMEYYKLVVELEQLKEPAVDDYNYYNYEKNENNDFVIDLESNAIFLNIFNVNRDSIITRWPKDLNITLEIGIEEKKYPILNYTYLFDDIKEINTATKKVKLQLSSFELNYGTLSSKFEKDEEGIDELENLIKQQKTVEEVINILKIELDSRLTFDNKLSFALSSKNPTLSQIYSELRKVNSHSVAENSVLSNFLFNKSIDNKLNSFSENDLIQISNLDDSQKNAVLTAFNNKVTVITGPPGSGKTQVISNILANAVMQNKKVLVASKNNQAVDNVKSRFDKEENSGFFLRFGNKKILGDTTLPEINRISALKSTLLDNAIQLNENQEKLNAVTKLKIDNNRKLEQRDLRQSELPELKKNIECLENKLLNISQNNSEFEKIKLNHTIDIVEAILSSTKKKRNHFELKYSGLNKFWIDWFTKKKYALELVNFLNETNSDFNELLNEIPDQISLFKNGSKILDSYNKTINSFNLIIEYYAAHSKIKIELQTKIDEIKLFENYINIVNSQEQKIKHTILECEQKIISLS